MPKPRRTRAADVRSDLTHAMARWGWSPAEVAGLLQPKRGRGKGSAFEREVCKTLSLWWTDGAREDVFWRTAGSGARATVRGRAGATTANSYGDVGALDAVGAPLVGLITIELKRGYHNDTPYDLADCPTHPAVGAWADFVAQARASAVAAGTPWWAIITRRDRRATMFTAPYALWHHLRTHHGVQLMPTVQRYDVQHAGRIIGIPFDDWRALVRPDYLIKTHARLNG